MIKTRKRGQEEGYADHGGVGLGMFEKSRDEGM